MIKLADTLAPMANFPAVEAKDVALKKADGTEKSIQNMYDDNEFGGDSGDNIQVGTLIQQYKKKPISGYLYCDGSTFDENAYPALYMYLGTNVLPDYRECVMVGAEQNTTDTIATHDVYTEGEFKDDQLQSHKHNFGNGILYLKDTAGWSSNGVRSGTGNTEETMTVEGVTNSRSGETTHGKQKAVYVYIKATSGLAENQQENVLNDVKNYIDGSNSYSTDEVKTGGKWIDGKPIYRKTISCGALPNNTTKKVAHGISNLGRVIKTEGYSVGSAGSSGSFIPVPYVSGVPMAMYIDTADIVLQTSGTYSNYSDTYVTIEYTKTTD